MQKLTMENRLTLLMDRLASLASAVAALSSVMPCSCREDEALMCAKCEAEQAAVLISEEMDRYLQFDGAGTGEEILH